MRQWIDLVENKNRSRKNLEAKALPFFEKIIKGNRSRREPKMFRDINDFVRTLTTLDPTNGYERTKDGYGQPRTEAKYFDWLLRMFMKEPWMKIARGWKDKRVWTDDWQKVNQISDALKVFETGKVTPRDINAYKSVDELIAACQHVPKKAEPFRMKLEWNESGRGCNATVFMNGEKAGNFIIDFTHKAEKKVSIHSFLRNEYMGKGHGARIYGWIAAKLREKGYTLIPSDRLTDPAYGLWKKRDPASVEGYERVESRESPNGFLWLSPYWREVVIPRQQKEDEKRKAERAKWEAERKSGVKQPRYTLDQLIKGDDLKGLPPEPEDKAA